MKKVLPIIFTLIFLIKTKAQQADLATHNAVNDTLIALFNKQAFREMYPLLSDNFKSQMTENELVEFMKKQLYEPLGRVSESIYLKKKEGAELYKWSFDKMDFEFSLTVIANKLIDGFTFLPYKEVPKQRVNIAASDNPLKTPLDKSIDSIARLYIDKSHTAGLSIGILKDGQVFTFNYGEVDKTTKKMPDSRTYYEIGSITKTFTGTLLAQAVLDKKINLEDDIRKYLPEPYPNLEFNGQPILIKHLANHTSRLEGFPLDIQSKKDFNVKNPYKYYSAEMVLAYLHTVKLDTAPGFKFTYSNYATGLMGIILEKTYKMPYADLVKKFITNPLSMAATKIDVTPKDSLIFAKPHKANGRLGDYWDFTGLVAAGAIRSNVTDMLQYAGANMRQSNDASKLAQQATFKENTNKSTALYWVLSTLKTGQSFIWHNGMTGGFSSFCGFSKEKNIAVVLLSNCADDVTQKGFDMLKAIEK